MSVDRIAAEKLKWYLGAIPLAEILRPGDEAPGDGDVEDLVGVLGEGVLLPDPAPATVNKLVGLFGPDPKPPCGSPLVAGDLDLVLGLPGTERAADVRDNAGDTPREDGAVLGDDGRDGVC